MEYQDIRYAVDESVLTLTLHRPDKLNAFTARMMHELIDAFDRADADDGVRAIIVTGAGRAFCAGADLSAGSGTFDASQPGQPVAHARPQTIDEHRDGGGQVTLRIFESKKPVIAAINGPAVGVGITMTLPMDIRIASSAARMGFVFAKRGIVPEACSSWFLPRVVGISQAAEWVYTGRIFNADEALAGRLVSRVVPPEMLMDTARSLAQGDRHQHLGDVRGAVAPALVAHAGRRSSDGGPQGRLAVHLLDGQPCGCARGGRVLSGKTAATFLPAPERRHARVLSVVARAPLQIERPCGRNDAFAQTSTPPWKRDAKHPRPSKEVVRARLAASERTAAAWL